MKKQTKKLVLARETVWDLTTKDLKAAAGQDSSECSGFWDRFKTATSYRCN